jgi:hypothetical protein
VTPVQTKIVGVVVSALTAAAITGLTARLGHAPPEACIIGALLSLFKDLHSFTSTAPKDVSSP